MTRWRTTPIKSLRYEGDGTYVAAGEQFHVMRMPNGDWNIEEYVWPSEEGYEMTPVRGRKQERAATLEEAIEIINEWIADPRQGPIVDAAVQAISSFEGWNDLLYSLLNYDFIPTIHPTSPDHILVRRVIQANGFRVWPSY